MLHSLRHCAARSTAMGVRCSAGAALTRAAALPTAAARAAATAGLPAWQRGCLLSHARQLSGGGGSRFRPRHHRERPSPGVVRAMRERAEARDPQLQQRRERLERGHHHFFATCHPGLEAVVAAELAGASIGATNVHPGKAGVSFTGDLSVGYRANLWLRSAIRVLLLLRETVLDARRPAGEEVYAAFRESADWARLLAPGQTFSVDSRVWSCSNLSSSQLLSVRAKDAVCDAIRDARGSKPLPPEPGRVADLPLYCTAYHDRLTIYRDMSGASLHRRGYRQAMHRASLNEAAAAGILYLSGWHELCRQEGAVLADPMCGSGTFLIEAALMATDVAPGSFRRWWPFMQWPDYNRAAWMQAAEAAASGRHAPPAGVEVWGNDVHQGALGLAMRDVQAAGMARMVRLHHGECRDWVLPRPPALVLSNPPWGQRLLGGGRGDGGGGGDGGSTATDPGSMSGYTADSASSGGGGADAELDWWDDEAPPEQQAAAAAAHARQEAEQRRRQGGGRGGGEEEARRREREAADLAAAWWDLSAFMKKQCGGATAFLLSGNPDASTGLRMKASRRYPLTVGGVDCRLLRYSIRGMDVKAGAAAGPAAAAAAGAQAGADAAAATAGLPPAAVGAAEGGARGGCSEP